MERFPREALYVYESVKMEMNYLNTNEEKSEDPSEYSNVMLMRGEYIYMLFSYYLFEELRHSN